MSNKLTRVCFLNPHGYVDYPAPLGSTDTGGQTLYELQLAKALGKKGIKVDIVTRLFDNKEKVQQIFPNVKIIRIPCGSNEFVTKEKMFELMPEFTANFLDHINKSHKKYSIIHSHYWDAGYAGVLLKKKLKVPHVHSPHSLGKLKKIEMAVEGLPVAKLKHMYRYQVRNTLEQRIYSVADAIVVLCETNRIQLLQHYDVDFEKIKVIFPGIESEYFNTKPNGFDKKIKFEENAILTISRLVPAKGIDRVIEALGLIKNKINFHLYMGGGSKTEQVSNEEKANILRVYDLIKHHHLEKRVQFLGFVDHDTQVPAYYRKADLFVLPSRFEPFGLTTMEAMACGTTPIVSNTAGSKEIIVDSLNGFIVDTHDRKKLAALILRVLSDRKVNKKVAENAAFTVRENYSWDKIVDKFIYLYKELGK